MCWIKPAGDLVGVDDRRNRVVDVPQPFEDLTSKRALAGPFGPAIRAGDPIELGQLQFGGDRRTVVVQPEFRSVGRRETPR